MQSVINNLYEWSVRWQLDISISKCSSMTISNRVDSNYKYNINGNAIPTVETVKDLGVYIDNRLKYNAHVNNIVAKARQRLGLLFKCFITRDAKSLTKAYITYVRPILEYASTVWNPTAVGLLCKLESVQRYFTRRILGFTGLNYKERNIMLNMESLELRRLKADLVMTYKIIFGLVDVNCQSFFTLRNNSITRGHDYKLAVENFKLNCRKNFFSIRVANVWNSLPENVNFDHLKSFKRCLELIDFSNFISF